MTPLGGERIREKRFQKCRIAKQQQELVSARTGAETDLLFLVEGGLLTKAKAKP